MANRIVSVGDAKRAQLIAAMLDPLPETGRVFERASKRGFVTYTAGAYTRPLQLNLSRF